MKLTDEKIAELAPDWATHYHINLRNESVLFENDEFFVIYYIDEGEFSETYGQARYGIDENSKPIPRKPEPFDITQHEWSDEAKDCGISFCCPLWVMPDIEINIKDANGGDNTGVLIKEHAIAIAKHFSLTAEDLK